MSGCKNKSHLTPGGKVKKRLTENSRGVEMGKKKGIEGIAGKEGHHLHNFVRKGRENGGGGNDGQEETSGKPIIVLKKTTPREGKTCGGLRYREVSHGKKPSLITS